MIGAKQRPSFTLIELLITAAIFSTAALLATTVFSNVQSTQRRIQSQQRVNTDGRYVLETISRSIRTGNINYAEFPNSVVSPNPSQTISTIDQNGTYTCYQLDTEHHKVDVAINASADCVTVANWVAFTPDDLQVNALNFFVQPVSNPFRPIPRSESDCKIARIPPFTSNPNFPVTGGFDSTKGACICTGNTSCFDGQACTVSGTTSICTNPNVQPHVTIYISTTSLNTGAGEQATSTIQTTVTSRLYQ